jgi:dTDP-glucose 4,6-dehydratase
MSSKILITGGASFIGSEFTRQAVERGFKVVVIDKLTYAGDLDRLANVKSKIKLYKQDICDKKNIIATFKKEKPETVVHFAAESHVDRSILGSDDFVRTNVCGTQVMLDASRAPHVKKFIHISTDEVYGDIDVGQFYETTSLNPSSPYSASKASADLFIKAYIRTFGLPAIIVRPSNNYGPWQYPEKFIPVAIYKAMHNEKIPIYGKGVNVREWLYVSDCAEAIWHILEKGQVGQIYNVGSGSERKNIEVAQAILAILEKPSRLIEFVADRRGHDLRYSLDFGKIKDEIGWRPSINFETGLAKTVAWYRDNSKWLEKKAKFLKSYWKTIYK